MTRLECHELALLYARLIADGDSAAGAVLTALHGQPEPVLVTAPPDDQGPKTRSKMSPDERRAWDAARKREQRASRISATNQCDIGATNGATSVRQNLDVQKGSQTLQKAEEKRKPSDSGYLSAEIENSQNQEKPQLPSRIGATIGATSSATSSATLVRIVQPKPQVSGPALLWLVWCQLTQTRGRPGQRDQQRLIDAWDTAVAIGERRDLPPAEVFRRAAEAFLADDDVNAKRLPLAVLCTQLARWAMPGSAKRGPVHATKAEDFDASGDDFAHLDEVNHG